MDWPMVRSVERQATRTADMMAKLHVDPQKLVRLRSGEAFVEVRTKCIQCSHARECLSWLDADLPASETPLFCPNLQLFETCRESN